MDKEILINQELLNELAKARLNAESDEPRAVNAFYDSRIKRIVINFNNGSMFAFPARLGQGLLMASDEDLAKVKITPSGEGLYWEALDVDLSIPALISGVYGTQRWMRWLAKRAGSSTSLAKANAARSNGKKGGRPPSRTLVVATKTGIIKKPLSSNFEQVSAYNNADEAVEV